VKSINAITSNLSFIKFNKVIEKMSVKSIMFEIEGLIKNTVMSCASLYGFSVEEALAKIDSNGNLIKAVVDKEAKKAEKLRAKVQKEAEKEAEKIQKEAEKAEKLKQKIQKEAEKIQKEAEKIQKEAEKEEKLRAKEALEAERSSMKEEEILSKAAEKLALKQAKEAEKLRVKEAKKVKKVAVVVDEPCVKLSSKDDDNCFILFQNIPLMDEINSIRDVKKFKNYKKLSAGVKLARQIMDI